MQKNGWDSIKTGISIISHGGIGKSDEDGKTLRNLTASCHELAVWNQENVIRILNDIWGYQWTGSLERDIEAIANGTSFIVLTHPHMDHIGDLPLLFANGKTYAGRIISTPGTKRAAEIALMDAAKIQLENYTRSLIKSQEEIKEVSHLLHFLQKKPKTQTSKWDNTRESNAPSYQEQCKDIEKILLEKYDIKKTDTDWEKKLQPPEPAFTSMDVERAINHIETHSIGEWWTVLVPWKISLRFYNAGHIIGSAMPLYKIMDENNKPHHILFSGDIGSYKWDFHINGIPSPPNNLPIDAVVIESTYGGIVRDRFEEGRTEWEDSLINAFKDNKHRKAYNRVIHACFSLDRLQNILFRVISLKKTGAISGPIYVDSPMGLAYIQAYILEARRTLRELQEPHQESIRKSVGDDYMIRERKLLEDFIEYLNPINGNYIPVTTDAERKALMRKPDGQKSGWRNRKEEPKNIITTSGMANGWPIISYLSAWGEDEQTAVYFPWHLAEWTLGNKIAGPNQMKTGISISGKNTTIRARMKNFTFLSWHSDEEDDLVFLDSIKFRRNSKIVVVHGDIQKSSARLGNTLKRSGYKEKGVVIPDIEEEVVVRDGQISLLRLFATVNEKVNIICWEKFESSISIDETLSILESDLMMHQEALVYLDEDFKDKPEKDKEDRKGELQNAINKLKKQIGGLMSQKKA